MLQKHLTSRIPRTVSHGMVHKAWAQCNAPRRRPLPQLLRYLNDMPCSCLGPVCAEREPLRVRAIMRCDGVQHSKLLNSMLTTAPPSLRVASLRAASNMHVAITVLACELRYSFWGSCTEQEKHLKHVIMVRRSSNSGRISMACAFLNALLAQSSHRILIATYQRHIGAIFPVSK